MIRRSNLEPTKKYKAPQTTSQEIGWITTPLVKIKHSLSNYLEFEINLSYMRSLKMTKKIVGLTFIETAQKLPLTQRNTSKCFLKKKRLMEIQQLKRNNLIFLLN